MFLKPDRFGVKMIDFSYTGPPQTVAVGPVKARYVRLFPNQYTSRCGSLLLDRKTAAVAGLMSLRIMENKQAA
jgi:hypothetical protein